MKRQNAFFAAAVALYGTLAYLLSFAAILYSIGFVENLFVPRSIDQGGGTDLDVVWCILIDVALIALFGLQHSVMARPAFKKAWKRFVPDVMERSTYIVFSSVALGALMWHWHPIGPSVWELGAVGSVVATAISFLGWGVVLLSTFLIDHFELFGLRQSFRNLRDSRQDEPHFRTPFLYRLVRHPLYLGFLMAFWAAPRMTVGHLLFALTLTIYIVFAITLEEADLVGQFGSQYRDYQRKVGKLIPKFGRGG